jgi:[calcium/calmodulin-dependent protein kinase] kinase
MKIANKSKLKKKLLSRQKSAYTLLEQEIATLKKLDHPNTVKLYEVIDDPAEDKLYLIIEFMEKGSIGSKSYWKEEGFDADAPKPSLPAERLRKYIREFLMGLDYRKSLRYNVVHNFALIFHRDIKPDNLLID